MARLQQLYDMIYEQDLLLEVKVCRVRDAAHAYDALAGISYDGDTEDLRVILDLPIPVCRELLIQQVSYFNTLGAYY